MKHRRLIPVVALSFVACGGGEPGSGGNNNDTNTSSSSTMQPAATRPPPTGPLTIPDWYTRDDDTETIHLVIGAGDIPDNNYWNFNGAINGDIAITVPLGYNVMVHFDNADPNMAHSLGVSPQIENFMVPPEATPIFEGAITQNPGSMIDGTMPGEEETVEFVAEQAGNYALVCYIPGHTAVGMWLHFTVSAEGEGGVQARQL